MTASRAITIAAIAGTILLIPVIVILSLGLYGSSIAADLAAIEPRGPKVAADPEQGPPGSSITLRGSNWIPETLARLEMVVRPSKPTITAAGEVVEEASPLPPVFIGTVITSRVGTFSVTANVPTSFPLRSGDDVDFVVTATYRGGEPAGRATGSFRIEPGPGGIEVQVYAEREGAPLPAALVELRGGQGQTLAAARADASGKALFAGLPAEARYRVMARAPGFGVLTAEKRGDDRGRSTGSDVCALQRGCGPRVCGRGPGRRRTRLTYGAGPGVNGAGFGDRDRPQPADVGAGR